MDSAICAVTRDVLQSTTTTPLVAKPRLTDALLKRPPFRFLHDIVSAVQRKTDFAVGVLTEEESDVQWLGERRERKVAYLEKLIGAVEAAEGRSLNIDPNKILAGVEPERTNLLLQTLGRVAVAEATVEQLNANPSPTPYPFMRSRPPSRRGTQESLDVTHAERGSPEDHNGRWIDTDDLPEHPVDGRQTWTGSSPSSVTSGDSAASSLVPEVDISSPHEGRPLSSEGVRIRELRREEVAVVEEASPGIVLRRRRSVGSKPKTGADVVDLIETFGRFGTLTSSLGRAVHHLFSAMDPMREELALWQREASLCADRLRVSNGAAHRDDPAEKEMRDLDEEIEKRRKSIRALKHAVACNAETIMKMLQSLTSDS